MYTLRGEKRRTVNPVLLIKDTSDDTRTEGSGRIEGATSVEYANEFSDEKSKTDSDWCNKGGLVLFFC
jgi:hypothetical protein